MYTLSSLCDPEGSGELKRELKEVECRYLMPVDNCISVCVIQFNNLTYEANRVEFQNKL